MELFLLFKKDICAEMDDDIQKEKIKSLLKEYLYEDGEKIIFTDDTSISLKKLNDIAKILNIDDFQISIDLGYDPGDQQLIIEI